VNGGPVIEINGLTKSFGDKVVVNDVDLTVNRGEIVGFLGPNGSGKTTTIRMICGLLSADSGSGRCLGYDIRTEADLIKREVGYMTQRFSFYEDLTIRENLDFVARLYDLRPRQREWSEVLPGFVPPACSQRLGREQGRSIRFKRELVGPAKPMRREGFDDRVEVRLTGSTPRSGEPATWGSGQR